LRPELTFSLVLTAATLLEGWQYGKRFLIFLQRSRLLSLFVGHL